MLPIDSHTKIDQWTINGKKYSVELPPVGEGTYGIVYKAFDHSLNKFIAIKEFKEAPFKGEIKALKQFKSTPYIIKYLDDIECKITKKFYLMLEYFEGYTLKEKISYHNKKAEDKGWKSKGLPEQSVLRISQQLLSGFEAMHQKGYRHCDIKPDNILVNDNNDIKIIDLGLANPITRSMPGTLLYSPPQHFQPQQNPPTWARDAWSLGLVIDEMLVGQNRFIHILQQINNREEFIFKMIKKSKSGLAIKYGPQYSSDWSQLTQRMLRYNVKDRPAMKDILSHLQIIRANITQLNKSFQIKYRNIFKTLIQSQKRPMDPSEKPEVIFKSENMLVKSVRYLKFFYRKYQFLPLFCQFIAKSKHPFVPNVCKYLMIFLSLSLYLQSIKKLLSFLKNNKIVIDFQHKDIAQQVNFPELIKMDQTNLASIFQCYEEFYHQQFNKYKNKLQQKVIPKLLGLLESHNHKISIQRKNTLIYLIKDEHSLYDEEINRESFINHFQKIREIYQSHKIGQLKDYFYVSDYAIYLLTFIISKFDEFFENSRVASFEQIHKLYSVLSLCRQGSDQETQKNSNIAGRILKQIEKLQGVKN